MPLLCRRARVPCFRGAWQRRSGGGGAGLRGARLSRLRLLHVLEGKQVSCRKGREVTLAHYRCRVESGRAGRCGRRVLGNRCSERRNSIPTEINARVKCRKGDTRVIYTYQQNT